MIIFMNEYLKFAETIARNAGDIIKGNFKAGMKKEWKSDNSPVTETDLKVNTLLLKEVKKHFPDHRVLAEEESMMEGDGEFVWVCDPVDGTIPFSHGIPICTFSLALTRNGESILGVVYEPFQNRMFTAFKGGGAFLNGEKIHVSSSNQLRGTAGEYEMYESAQFDVSKLGSHLEMNEGVKLMKLCSIVYPSMLVAMGELAFTIFPGVTAHDGAAVKIIVEEAGGKVTSLYGEDQRYDAPLQGFIASNGILHDELLSLVRSMVNDRRSN
jgi:fructose-1,6-bisphosphatase/inositol monophosphatase family enzyme